MGGVVRDFLGGGDNKAARRMDAARRKAEREAREREAQEKAVGEAVDVREKRRERQKSKQKGEGRESTILTSKKPKARKSASILGDKLGDDEESLLG